MNSNFTRCDQLHMSFVGHRLYRVRTHVLLLIVCDFLYRREILLRRVEVVDCYLVHCDVHYGTMTSMPAVVSMEIGLAYLGRAAASAAYSDDATAVFLLHLFARLEYRWQQTLILHEGTIMMIFSNCTYSTNNT